MGRCCWWFTGEGVELMVGKESFICIDCKGQKSWYAIRCHTCNKKLYTKFIFIFIKLIKLNNII